MSAIRRRSGGKKKGRMRKRILREKERVMKKGLVEKKQKRLRVRRAKRCEDGRGRERRTKAWRLENELVRWPRSSEGSRNRTQSEGGKVQREAKRT